MSLKLLTTGHLANCLAEDYASYGRTLHGSDDVEDFDPETGPTALEDPVLAISRAFHDRGAISLGHNQDGDNDNRQSREADQPCEETFESFALLFEDESDAQAPPLYVALKLGISAEIYD
mmetsp:Transcript_10787/g.14514  ORF Transcript_10787/g.14514 Transcript_10787/m.14514 type:complete len:120 (-) Transcript_10787:546-905(-)